jgi:ubiquinone/menaquinone biosynthesis C-methylase UbiE
LDKPNYDYHGLVATTWDVWRDNTADWADRFFYLDIVRKYGQPVLDVGCATGRLLLDYQAQGIDIDGVDNSPELLDICRDKASSQGLSPTLYLQHIESLDLPRQYRTILAPSSVFQLVTDADMARQTLHRFFAHLEPGGAFVTSFSFDWREGEPLDSGWGMKFEKPRPSDGAIVRNWVREWQEPEQQVWHSEQRFEIECDGEIIEREHHTQSPEGRWYTQSQVRELYQEAGFVDIQLFHEFTMEPALPDDRLFCALGVKP